MNGLVIFYARWCLVSHHLMETLDAMGVEYRRVDIDAEPELHRECAVWAVPTLILFRDGNEVGYKVGNVPERWIRFWLEEVGGVKSESGGSKPRRVRFPDLRMVPQRSAQALPIRLPGQGETAHQRG